MLARVHSVVLDGLDPRPVRVDVDVRPGLPSFTVLGLGDLACREIRERVQTALTAQGFALAQRRITVSLAPVSLGKDRVQGLDLPVAIGLLAATHQIPATTLDGTVIVGDLGLAGQVRAVRGTLQIAEQAELDQRQTLLVPAANLIEAAIVPDLRLLAPDSLHGAVVRLRARTWDDRPSVVYPLPETEMSMDDIHGLDTVKAQLTHAVQLDRSVLLVGPSGCGKTMLARRVSTLMSLMSEPERLEVTRIHSACGLHHAHGMSDTRPFRAPHHGTSTAGLLGSYSHPGEVTLAHHGILCFDDITRFDLDSIVAVAQAAQDGQVYFQRHGRVRSMPARAIMIATTAGCACGGVLTNPCRCSPDERRRFARALNAVRGLFDVEIMVTGTGDGEA